MISRQVLYKVNEQIGQDTKLTSCILSIKGVLLVGEKGIDIKSIIKDVVDRDVFVEGNCFYGKIIDTVNNANDLILVLKDENKIYNEDTLFVIGKMALGQLSILINSKKGNFDKSSFYLQILKDTELDENTYKIAKNLHIKTDEKRLVILFETKEAESEMLKSALKDYFSSTSTVILRLSKNRLVVIGKDISEGEIKIVANMLEAEAMISFHIAYYKYADNIEDLKAVYEKTVLAMEIGTTFYKERRIFSYNKMGIGKLLYNIPDRINKEFLTEISSEKFADLLDEEEVRVANSFFKNNLNVSESARELYMHRNTLTHRIEKILQKTNLDIRKFDDACTLKIAFLIAKNVR
ncbi:MAG: helix-turn-helix domain-containing protein [Lachnospiraceae bacterium]|jgi:carbohydrate diacid regulator|nr:helix-turn-helix domain-containing protein [Lachnospiraceae bacterium]